jgi:hypothetical protein
MHVIACRYALCRAGMSLRFLTTSRSLRAVEHAHAFPPRWSSDNERNGRPRELTDARSNCVQTAIGYSDDYSSNPLVELAITPFTGKPIDRSRCVLSLSFSLFLFLFSIEKRAVGHETRSRDTLVVIETHRCFVLGRTTRDEYMAS